MRAAQRLNDNMKRNYCYVTGAKCVKRGILIQCTVKKLE